MSQIEVSFPAPAFWWGLIISGILAWPSLLLLRRMKSESVISPYTSEAHQKKTGTPNMAGIFVVAAIVIVLLRFGEGAALIFIMLAFASIGFVDDYVVPKWTDKRGLGWMPKLLLELACVGVYVVLVGASAQSYWTAFFVLLFSNAVNFTDGLDGLAGAIMFVAFIAFPGVLGAAVMGAILPFLILNAPPAKVFMGDVGALALGAAFGYAFSLAPWNAAAWPWIASFILVIELILVPIQIAAVKTIKRRIFPATPIHHAFEQIGWPESRIVWVFVVSQVILTSLAIYQRSGNV